MVKYKNCHTTILKINGMTSNLANRPVQVLLQMHGDPTIKSTQDSAGWRPVASLEGTVFMPTWTQEISAKFQTKLFLQKSYVEVSRNITTVSISYLQWKYTYKYFRGSKSLEQSSTNRKTVPCGLEKVVVTLSKALTRSRWLTANTQKFWHQRHGSKQPWMIDWSFWLRQFTVPVIYSSGSALSISEMSFYSKSRCRYNVKVRWLFSFSRTLDWVFLGWFSEIKAVLGLRLIKRKPL